MRVIIFLILFGLMMGTTSACKKTLDGVRIKTKCRRDSLDIANHPESEGKFRDIADIVGWGEDFIRTGIQRSADRPTEEGVFSLLDGNGDGFLTVEEWHAQGGSDINFAKILEDMDKDGDKTISWVEFQAVEDKRQG